jgi:hypothetical protein
MIKAVKYASTLMTTAGLLLTGSGLALADISPDSKPPVGRSLFDFLVTEKNGSGGYDYKVPYPLKDLVEQLSKKAGGLEGSGGPGRTAEPVMVLIPNGRSLQRDTTNLNNPRGLVGFTDHPQVNSDISIVLKDRLFIGLSRKAHQLEVISYNEKAGRFEFQLVTDYKEGATPKVVYANRAFCTECHKAATPIFSKNTWDETNANVGVYTALMKDNDEAEDFFGIIKTRGSRGASYAYDTATDRANRIPHMQKLWKKGCSDTAAAGVAAFTPEACRASVYILGLSAANGIEYWQLSQASVVNYDHVLASWKANLDQNDLQFMLGDIPNRNPSGFEEIQMTTIDREADRIEFWTKNLKDNHTIDPAADPKTMTPVPYAFFAGGDQHAEALELMLTYISGSLTPSERSALGKTAAKFNALVTDKAANIIQAGAATKVFDGSPMIKGELLKTVLAGAGITDLNGEAVGVSCCNHEAKLPPVKLDAGDSNESSSLAVFDKHCYAACHGSFPEPLGFLKRQPGVSDREVWLKIVETEADQLCVRLDWNLPHTELAPANRMPRGPKQAALAAEEKASGKSDRKVMMETYKGILEDFANDPAALQTLGLTAQDLKNYADACNWTVYNGQ